MCACVCFPSRSNTAATVSVEACERVRARPERLALGIRGHVEVAVINEGRVLFSCFGFSTEI